MKKILFATVVSVVAAVALAACGSPFIAEVGDIVIRDAWVRPAFVENGNGAAYMILENTGESDDTLLSVTADFAEMSQIHQTMVMEEEGEDAMTMQQMGSGLTIPAGETVALETGSYHVMLMGIADPLEAGDTVSLTLEFAQAGTVTIEVEVREE